MSERAYPIDCGPYLACKEVEPTMRVYEIRAGNRYLHGLEDGELRHHSDWHRIMIDEGTGYVNIEGGYGTFSYRWNARGGESLHAFLYHLDFDYFMKKASKKPHMVPDHEATLAQLRQEILDDRRRGDITRKKARDLWQVLEWHEDDHDRLVYKLYEDSHWSERLDSSDPTVMRPCGGLTRFWDEHWRPFCEQVLRPHWLQYQAERTAAKAAA